MRTPFTSPMLPESVTLDDRLSQQQIDARKCKADAEKEQYDLYGVTVSAGVAEQQREKVDHRLIELSRQSAGHNDDHAHGDAGSKREHCEVVCSRKTGLRRSQPVE